MVSGESGQARAMLVGGREGEREAGRAGVGRGREGRGGAGGVRSD